MKNIQIISIVLLLASFCSCQKVINVNLNSSSPRYVIEGNVTNLPGPYLLTITKSVNFNQLNIAPTVSGATVVITDNNTGLADTLTETSPGSYNTHTLVGTPGRKYLMYVNAGGNIFTASSTMPQLVSLDSLYTQESAFRGNSYSVVPVYTNNTNANSYYYFAEYRNDTETAAVFTRKGSSEVSGVISQSLGGGGDGSSLTDGDVVLIDMQCVDSGVYEYYTTLQQTNNQNSATPANPASNIAGGALGYFAAHTSSQRTVVVP